MIIGITIVFAELKLNDMLKGQKHSNSEVFGLKSN